MPTLITEPQARTDGVRTVITSHSLDSLFESCPRKFEFQVIRKQTLPYGNAFAADVGTALHEALQAGLISRANGAAPEQQDEDSMLALAKWYPFHLESSEKTGMRSFENCLVMAEFMLNDSIWDDWELMPLNDGWAVEVPFIIRHPNMVATSPDGQQYTFATQGKIDLIMRHKHTGEIRVRDIKTTSRSATSLDAVYYHSGQQTGYGFVLNAMLGIQPDAYTIEYVSYVFRSGYMPEVVPIKYKKRADVVADFWRQKKDVLTRLSGYLQQGWFPRRNGDCVMWNTECQFFSVCKTREERLIKRWFDIHGEPYNRVYAHTVEFELNL